MAISVFDIFKVGIGPSSSHTVGPMRAAKIFAEALQVSGKLHLTKRLKVELYGSLGATGKGHGSPKAIMLGLLGEDPEAVDVCGISERINHIRATEHIYLLGKQKIRFIENTDLLLLRNKTLPLHANGMVFTAYDREKKALDTRVYYSVGGGFVLDESAANKGTITKDQTELPYPFTTGEELLALTAKTGLSISAIMLQNETAWHTREDVKVRLLTLSEVMNNCIDLGCQSEGILPGGLKVKRRAAHLYRKLKNLDSDNQDPLNVLDWVSLYALAVNEENAAGGRIVTAPTNGAAGIIPAVLRYYMRFCKGARDEDVVAFLLTAAAIGILYKENASISGAEVGCQGEVGSACSMAAGALTEVLGGTPEQVENAAEIAMEHNLGLTCDPIGGLVQIPCIERNAMASIKAISAARMALRGDGKHFVSLDKVIKTMRETGKDMKEKYKETARGGLATNVIDVPINIIEC